MKDTLRDFIQAERAVGEDTIHKTGDGLGLSREEIEAEIFMLSFEGVIRFDGVSWVWLDPTGLTEEEERVVRDNGVDPHHIATFAKDLNLDVYTALDKWKEMAKIAGGFVKWLKSNPTNGNYNNK